MVNKPLVSRVLRTLRCRALPERNAFAGLVKVVFGSLFILSRMRHSFPNMLPITTQAFLALISIYLPQPNTRNDIFIHRKSLSPQFFINMVFAFVSVVSFHFLLLTSYVSNPTPGFSF